MPQKLGKGHHDRTRWRSAICVQRKGKRGRGDGEGNSSSKPGIIPTAPKCWEGKVSNVWGNKCPPIHIMNGERSDNAIIREIPERASSMDSTEAGETSRSSDCVDRLPGAPTA